MTPRTKLLHESKMTECLGPSTYCCCMPSCLYYHHRPFRSLDCKYLLVPRSRTSTSQLCAFTSAGPLLWNCLPVKTRVQILSSSFFSTSRILKSFLFPGAYRTGGRL